MAPIINEITSNNNCRDNDRVFLEIAVDGKRLGRVVVELFHEQAPMTTENFNRMCTGVGSTSMADKVLSYKGTKFHNIVPGFICEGGDNLRKNGSIGESIYGAHFPDENYKVKFDRKGRVAMSNTEFNENGSQFFITMKPAEWLNNENVVFGQVVEGMSFIESLQSYGDKFGRVSKDITISNCGVAFLPDPTF